MRLLENRLRLEHMACSLEHVADLTTIHVRMIIQTCLLSDYETFEVRQNLYACGANVGTIEGRSCSYVEAD